MEPPRYRRLSDESGDPQLPSYELDSRTHASQGPKSVHKYELVDGNFVWAVLKLRSRALSSSHLPAFMETDAIAGSVSLNLGHKEDHIMAVKILVTGRLTSSLASVHEVNTTFLEVRKTLWSKEMGDPRNPALDSSWRYSGKLSGTYEWPFTLTLPSETPLASNASSTSSASSSGPFRLPHTFLERHVSTSIQYDLHVFIERSRFRVDSNLHTMFAYIPAIRPGRASLLRQLSYHENTPLPGPYDDPDGYCDTPFVMQGRVFATREVLVNCCLFIAKPPSYTRGTPLPMTMVFSCADTQALELISSPDVLSVRLRRRVKGCKVGVIPSIPAPSSFRERTRHSGDNSTASIAFDSDCMEDVETAVWWPSTTPLPAAFRSTDPTRILDGEINLPKSLKPNTHIGHFAIEYNIVVFPSLSPGFTPAGVSHHRNQEPHPLCEVPVEIATLYPPGPRPRSQIDTRPPRYPNLSTRSNGGSNYSIPPVRGYI